MNQSPFLPFEISDDSLPNSQAISKRSQILRKEEGTAWSLDDVCIIPQGPFTLPLSVPSERVTKEMDLQI